MSAGRVHPVTSDEPASGDIAMAGGRAVAPSGESVPWRILFDEARCRLAGCDGVDSPDIDARRIVEAAAGAAPAAFEAALDEPATQRAAAWFYAMLQRRATGEPLQYVVGSWSFRTLDLMVDRRVLIPRPETEVVAGWAVDEAAGRAAAGGRDHEVMVVDLGTGSGAIALSVAAECPRARVYATDVSAEALAVAGANLAGLGRAAARVTLHEGDWFEALPEDLRGSVDLVVCNPPYIGTGEALPAVVADWEPPVALWSGPTGREAVEQIAAGAPEWLCGGGALIMETASHRAQETASAVETAGFADVRVEQDLAGLDRVVIGRLR